MGELLLPLFPLKVVLFPRTDLALHIFEDRYKQMIGECMENQGEFGVVLAQEQAVENTGCTAAITKVVKRYEDGKLDIMVRGSRRFEILLLNQELAYLRGSPQFFEDEEAPLAPDDPRRKQAMELFSRMWDLLELKASRKEPTDLQAGDEQLSYQIMARLPVDLEFKQTLLPLRSEQDRLKRVIEYLEQLLVQVSVTIKTRASASGNGRGH
jgi:ATP-dependent Lon protease